MRSGERGLSVKSSCNFSVREKADWLSHPVFISPSHHSLGWHLCVLVCNMCGCLSALFANVFVWYHSVCACYQGRSYTAGSRHSLAQASRAPQLLCTVSLHTSIGSTSSSPWLNSVPAYIKSIHLLPFNTLKSLKYPDWFLVSIILTSTSKIRVKNKLFWDVV